MAKLPPQPIGVPPGSSYWNDWYEKLRLLVEQALSAVINFVDLNFAGSNLTSIQTRNHNDLQNIQGGAPGEYNHLTNAQVALITTGANPTASVGLAAVNGSAATFMRSDGAPALSQAISPTWTGNHTFSPAAGNTLFSAGNVGINATPSAKFHILSTGEIFRVETSTARGSGSNYFTFYDPTGIKAFIGFTGSTNDDFLVRNSMNANLNFATNATLRWQMDSSGNLAGQTVGTGLRVKEGSNAKQGTATLVAGTVTVANTSVTANSRIFLTSQVDGGTPGFLRVSARVASTSFTITSSNAADTSTVAYEIFEPS